MRKMLASIMALMFTAIVYADDDYDHYQRPPYQGGLIDSYDRYDPQLHRNLYGTPNGSDYEYHHSYRESRVPTQREPLCIYTCGMNDRSQ